MFILIRGTSRWVSQNWKTLNIYFGLSGHHQELNNTEKYRIFGVCFMKQVRKGPDIKTCDKHSAMKEDIGTTHTHTQKKTVLRDCCLELIRNSFSCSFKIGNRVQLQLFQISPKQESLSTVFCLCVVAICSFIFIFFIFLLWMTQLHVMKYLNKNLIKTGTEKDPSGGPQEPDFVHFFILVGHLAIGVSVYGWGC